MYQVGINKGIILRCTAYQISRYQAILSHLLLIFIVLVICFNFRLLKNSESMASQPGLLVGMLDIVLNKEVKTLEMEDFRLRDDFEIWPLVLKKCTGLER